ncbi:SHOCT domain-containing protein [Glutamicibacter sp. NPDC087344]|uniref:SHOCT domain-containing protein n=1 Tax=Glutamicibacter sp. NPDC087344 TaxID=3363994 RepID=UPI00380E017A
MDLWNSLWNIIWVIISGFVFIAYLIALFSIITDLFRDRELSGWWKALWLVLLLFVPFLTSLVYLVTRGKGMAERSHKAAVGNAHAVEDYIRTVAQVSPSDEIAKAKALLDAGTITSEEFDILRAQALGQAKASSTATQS